MSIARERPPGLPVETLVSATARTVCVCAWLAVGCGRIAPSNDEADAVEAGYDTAVDSTVESDTFTLDDAVEYTDSPGVDSGIDTLPDSNSFPADAMAADSDVGSCSLLDPGPPTITQQGIAENPPILQGGTLSSGTYVLVELIYYEGPGGTSGPGFLKLSEVLQLTIDGAGNISGQGAVQRNDVGAVSFSLSGTVTATVWKYQFTCGPALGMTVANDYEVDGSDLRFNARGSPIMYHYQKAY